MIREVAVRVAPVLGHELHHLQQAVGAVDVRNGNIGFPKSGRPFGMREQAVRDHWSHGSVLNDGGDGLLTTLTAAGRDDRIGRQLRRVACQRNTVVTRVEHGLLNQQVEG